MEKRRDTLSTHTHTQTYANMRIKTLNGQPQGNDSEMLNYQERQKQENIAKTAHAYQAKMISRKLP